MFKFITFFAISSVAYAGVLEAPASVAVAQPVLARHIEEYDPHPRYNFAYEVHDAVTGDSKSQVESRDGDIVQGQYWLIDADGYKRIVDYTADSVNGFNAIVRREPTAFAGHAANPAIVKNAPVTVAAAPTLAVSPLAHSTLSRALIKSAPVTAYASAPSYVQSAPLIVSKGPAAPASYFAPAAYAQPAYSSPAVYGSQHLINAAAPATILAKSSHAAPTLLNSASYATAGPILYKNLQAPLISTGVLKNAHYAH